MMGFLLFLIIGFGVMYLILGILFVFLFVCEIKKGVDYDDYKDVFVLMDLFS